MIYVDSSLHETFNKLLEVTYREKATQDTIGRRSRKSDSMQRTTTSIATHANLPIMPSTTREWKRLCFPGWCGEKLNHNKFREVLQVCHQRAMLKPIGSFHETPRVRTENAPSASSENGVRRHLEDARDPADPSNPPSWAWLESGELETINSQSSNRINCIYYHLLMTTSILLVLLEHAGALLSMEYPAVNLKNLKFEGSTVGISHISDISIRNPSGNPPTFFLDICWGASTRVAFPDFPLATELGACLFTGTQD